MRTDNMAADDWNNEQITKTNKVHTWGVHSMFLWSFFCVLDLFKMIKRTLHTRCPLDCQPTQAWIMTEPLVYAANVLKHYKICHISLLAYELWQQCPVPFVLLQMTTKKTDPLLSLFIHVLIAGRGWHRVLLWDQLEGGINIFFSGKANGSNRKHLRTGDRNRSDCIAVTDNVAQACRLQEVTAIYGRKAVKGRGGKFHWTMSLRDGRTDSNSQQLSKTTKKTCTFPLWGYQIGSFLLIFIFSL